MYKARQFQAPEGAEVSGIILMAYLNNLAHNITEPILEQYGFDVSNIDVDQWYPNQMFLDIEQTIYQNGDGSNALVAIGKAAVENYIPPKGVKTLEDAIMALPSVYTTNQRNLPDGYGWIIEKKAENHFVFTNNTGTSNHGAYGYVWALCQRMRPLDAKVKVIPLKGFEAGSLEPTVIDIQW
ncbi:MAG: hypothetical protein WBC91_05695 [Phototrophicaceae bacterium]